MGDWLLHPRRRHLADALVIAWVVAWALLGWTAGRALDKVSEVTRSAEGAGAAVVRTGESIRVDVPVVGTVFQEAGDQVPSLPLLVSYGPARLARGHERRALHALLRDNADDPELDRLLAIRAIAHLPYRRLHALGAPRAPDRVLADAELAREGVTRS